MMAWTRRAAAAIVMLPAAIALGAPEDFTPADGSGITYKPSAPVAIEHRFLGEPALGQSLEIVVTITALNDLDRVAVSFTTDEGLELLAPLASVALGAMADASAEEILVTVLPLVDQHTHLNIAVSAELGTMFRGRALAITIPLGSAKTDVSGVERKQTADGETLSSFSATETLR